MLRKTVVKTLREILRDPDFGLEIQDWVEERLKKEPGELISLEEVEDLN